jgi:branched-chain amino acid transport system ATP-binding protein
MGYGRGAVISDLSFELTSKGFAAIFGQNGSGKSTLLKGIAGLLPVQSGEILVDGERVQHLPAWERVERGVRILLQSERVFPEFDVYTNVEMGGYQIRSKVDREQRVQEAFKTTDLFEGRLREPAASLSGGEQQILALLRTLVMKPKLLLLDEPSTGLSPGMQDKVGSMLTNLNDQGVSVLIAEQNVSFARSIARSYFELTPRELRPLEG